jgi:hypothetical protein
MGNPTIPRRVVSDFDRRYSDETAGCPLMRFHRMSGQSREARSVSLKVTASAVP